LSYIVSWEADINARDSKGLTPLHLAVKSSEDLQSTRSIRHLLIKGADKRVQVSVMKFDSVYRIMREEILWILLEI
jgi:ankyrin repeat protein